MRAQWFQRKKMERSVFVIAAGICGGLPAQRPRVPIGMTGIAVPAEAVGHKTPIVAFLHLPRVFTLFLAIPLLARHYFLLKGAQ